MRLKKPTTRIWYFRARYYNPAIDRFLSEDPAGFAGGSTFMPTLGAILPISTILPADCLLVQSLERPTVPSSVPWVQWKETNGTGKT